MKHPYIELKPEYERLLSTMVVTRPQAVEKAALSIIGNMGRHYLPVGNKMHVPAPFIGVLNMRESNENFHTGLGQGDPIDRPSTHVPRGHGPFKDWNEAAEFYIGFDHLNDTTQPWSLSYACWKGEAWNGFGPRNHGIHTGYLWAASNHERRGKYTGDSVWNANAWDMQLGIMPVMLRVIELHPEFAFGPAFPKDETVPFDPLPLPEALSNIKVVQLALNHRSAGAELAVDGSYGRRTREAIRRFQKLNGLTADGLAGPLTRRALGLA